jgi:hypothetical protein
MLFKGLLLLTGVSRRVASSQAEMHQKMSFFSGAKYFRAARFHDNVAVRTSPDRFPVEHVDIIRERQNGNWASS